MIGKQKKKKTDKTRTNFYPNPELIFQRQKKLENILNNSLSFFEKNKIYKENINYKLEKPITKIINRRHHLNQTK